MDKFMPRDTDYMVKVRMVGKKSWAFLSRNGTNRLRIHARRFATKEIAQEVADEIVRDNPDWEAKVAR